MIWLKALVKKTLRKKYILDYGLSRVTVNVHSLNFVVILYIYFIIHIALVWLRISERNPAHISFSFYTSCHFKSITIIIQKWNFIFLLSLSLTSKISVLAHLAQWAMWGIVITLRRRASSVNFSHFHLLLWNHWTDFN